MNARIKARQDHRAVLGLRNLALNLDAPRFHVHPRLTSALCSLVCWAVAAIFVVVAFETFFGK